MAYEGEGYQGIFDKLMSRRNRVGHDVQMGD